MRSTTSTDAPPGFTIRSVLGHGPRGTVYVAEQVGLGRGVALKLYTGSEPVGPWPEHPGVARLHAGGVTERGAFTASQLAAGGSLAQHLAAGSIAREDALALCEAAARTLADLGVAHGAIGPGNVLIDGGGRALLCDFGMPGVVPSAAADREALHALRARCAELPLRDGRRRRRSAVLGAAVVGVVLASIAVAVGLDGDDPRPPPAPVAGARVLGSDLAGPAPATLGCDGLPPSGSAPACTIAQLRRGGRASVFAADGVIRRWSVRGAAGALALQVVRPRPGGRYVVAATAQRVIAPDAGAHAFTTDLAVRRGDLAGLELTPQGGVGMRPGAGDVALRFVGPLTFASSEPRPSTGAALEAGIELRVEYVPGGRPRPVPTLTGGAARAAPDGRRLAARQLEFSGGRVRTVAVIAAGGRLAVDLLRGAERLTRVAVVGADPRGRLLSFDAPTATGTGAAVTWRNPDGAEVVHHYRTFVDRLVPVD